MPGSPAETATNSALSAEVWSQSTSLMTRWITGRSKLAEPPPSVDRTSSPGPVGVESTIAKTLTSLSELMSKRWGSPAIVTSEMPERPLPVTSTVPP